tara:strand:+ start:204 stop:512 length:309 start_codon:yes stop_codon:yes gene_type:complete
MAYNMTNENPEETPGLTKGDLAVASFALAETFNSYLNSYNEEDYGELTKEEMETSMHRLRVAFIKIDSMLRAMNQQEDEMALKELEKEAEESDENQDEETPS